jgi:two-component system, chemotaxis family, sensor kinase CheA
VIGTGGVMFALDTPALFARAAHWLEPEPEPDAPASPIAHEREEPCSAD